jgi:beta-aspartyl-peptidase (threonine type)
MADPILCVHGGAGALRRDDLPADAELRMRAGLRGALLAGQNVLVRGGGAVEAVAAAVVALETAEVFNAGRGSVLTSAGEVEMDASIMRGSDRAAGAVAVVRRIAHPVEAARCLLEQGEHVLLAGPAADAWGAEAGLRIESPDYFVTDLRRQQLAGARELDLDSPSMATVGAVALDAGGRLAAATSTGGLTRQAPGRVGDSPIVGAGTWADDRSCAVSATGTGEAILRAALAHQIAALIRIGGHGLGEACALGLADVEALGGRAGCIAVDAGGSFALPFTTPGMARGVACGSEEPRVALFADESLG